MVNRKPDLPHNTAVFKWHFTLKDSPIRSVQHITTMSIDELDIRYVTFAVKCACPDQRHRTHKESSIDLLLDLHSMSFQNKFTAFPMPFLGMPRICALCNLSSSKADQIETVDLLGLELGDIRFKIFSISVAQHPNLELYFLDKRVLLKAESDCFPQESMTREHLHSRGFTAISTRETGHTLKCTAIEAHLNQAVLHRYLSVPSTFETRKAGMEELVRILFNNGNFAFSEGVTIIDVTTVLGHSPMKAFMKDMRGFLT